MTVREQILRRLGMACATVVCAGLMLTADPARANAQAVPLADTQRLEPAESLEGNYLAAIIAGASRDTAAAALYFREALRADPRNVELLERAFAVFLADGSMNEAFSAAERLVSREPDHSLANLALGVRGLKTRQFQTARNILSRNTKGRAADITATLLSAWSWAGTGDGKRALETVDRLRGDRIYNVFRDYHGALIADFTNNRAEAARRFKAAYGVEQTTLRLVDAYGRFESRRGSADQAREIYQTLLKSYPDQPILKDALARIDAGQTLAPLVGSVQQGAAEALYGLVGGWQDDNVVSLIYLRLALYLDPDHVLALVSLGNTLERAKRTDAAIAIYERIPQDSPLRASADIQIALAYEMSDRHDMALARLAAVTKAHPDNVDAVTALGNVLRNRKKYDEAAEAYSRAIGMSGEGRSSWALYYYRGTSYERAKQWPKAEDDLKRALELVPLEQPRERAQVLNYLGYSWVDQNMNIEQAFQMLRQAVELSPRDGYIVDSLGWAYYRLGRFEDAVRELERAVELRPADPVINDHLGDAYWKVGRRLEARFQWSHAKDLNPEKEDLVRISDKLQNGLPEPEKPAAAENGTKPNGG